MELCCSCDDSVAAAWIGARRGGGDVSEATPEVGAVMAERMAAWPSAVTVDTSGHAPGEFVSVVLRETGTVDQWRSRIDELKVQADLAKLEARERATKQLEIAENACLAAYSKLRDARQDVLVNADTLREGVQKLLHDVKAAFEAAQAVITRG